MPAIFDNGKGDKLFSDVRTIGIQNRQAVAVVSSLVKDGNGRISPDIADRMIKLSMTKSYADAALRLALQRNLVPLFSQAAWKVSFFESPLLLRDDRRQGLFLEEPTIQTFDQPVQRYADTDADQEIVSSAIHHINAKTLSYVGMKNGETKAYQHQLETQYNQTDLLPIK